MLKIKFFRYSFAIIITTLVILPCTFAEEMTDKKIPKVSKEHEMDAVMSRIKAEDNTLKTLGWQREIGKKQVAQASYKMALYLMQKRDWGKAKNLINEAVNMQPQNPTYLKLAIHIAYNQHDYKMAEAYLLKVLSTQQEENPLAYADLLDNLAIIYKAQNRFNDAIIILHKSLSITEANTGDQYPKLIERLYRMSDLNLHLGDYGDALLQMEQTIQLLEKHPSESSVQEMAKAYHNIGDINRLQKQFGVAETAYLKALTLWDESTQQGKSGKSVTRKSLSHVQTAQKDQDI